MDSAQVHEAISDHVVLALEVAPVRVNLIAAGFVDSPLSASLIGDRLEERRNELRTTLLIGDTERRPFAVAGTYPLCGKGSPDRLSHPWKGERSPAAQASRSPGVLRSQSGRTSLVTARRSCHRS